MKEITEVIGGVLVFFAVDRFLKCSSHSTYHDEAKRSKLEFFLVILLCVFIWIVRSMK